MSLLIHFFYMLSIALYRFIQKRVVWGPSDRQKGMQIDARRNYLNTGPRQLEYDPSLNWCLLDSEKCQEDVDLVYYSKDEDLLVAADMSGYDWIITSDPR